MARRSQGQRKCQAPVELDISGIAGLALDGPGPPDVARSLVVALLAKGGPRVVRVLIPDATAAPLLPGVAGEGRFGPAEDVIQVPPGPPVPGLRPFRDGGTPLRLR